MGIEDEVTIGEHIHDDESEDFQHPWVSAMYQLKFSFNGNERSQLFMGKGDGTFLSYSGLSGADSPLDGRGLLAIDFDDDMDLDLFVHNIQRERHNLYRNVVNKPGRGLKVQLRGTEGSYEAVGATLIAKIGDRYMTQVLTRGAGFSSCQAPELVFGMGQDSEAELLVRWPYGKTESFGAVKAGSKVLLVQGAGKPEALPTKANPLPEPWPPGMRIPVGAKVPSFTVEDASGKRKTFDPANIPEGHVLHLNLWASYCGPCVKELPLLDELHRSEGHSVLGVSMDNGLQRAVASELLRAAGATYDNAFLLVEDEEAGKQIDAFLDLFRLSLPTTLEIDSSGTLLRVKQGEIESAEIHDGEKQARIDRDS